MFIKLGVLGEPDIILVIFLHKQIFKIFKIYPKKRVNCDISILKYYVFGVFIHLTGIKAQISYVYMLTLHIIKG